MNNMAWKFLDPCKQCKLCIGSTSTYKKGQRLYPDFDTILKEVLNHFIGGSCSSSIQVWDFPNHLGGILSSVNQDVKSKDVQLHFFKEANCRRGNADQRHCA